MKKVILLILFLISLKVSAQTYWTPGIPPKSASYSPSHRIDTTSTIVDSLRNHYFSNGNKWWLGYTAAQQNLRFMRKSDSTLYQTVSNFFPKADTRYVKLTRQIINGYGMLGGGTLATDRTLNVDTAGVHALVSKDRLATNLTGYLKKTDTGTTALPSIYSLEHRTWHFYNGLTVHGSNAIFEAGANLDMNNQSILNVSGIGIKDTNGALYNIQKFPGGAQIGTTSYGIFIDSTTNTIYTSGSRGGGAGIAYVKATDATFTGKQDKAPAIGTIYNAATITSTADWANNGLAGMSASGGKLIVTGVNSTSTDFTQSADLTSVGTTNYDKWTITATFTAPTPSATTGIVWFGMRSNNTTASVFNTSPFGIDLSNTGTQGTLYLRGGTGGVFLYATSTTKLTIAANDIIKIICTRSLWTYTARIMDITNPQADVKIEYTSTGPLISSMQNAGFFTVFTQTATPISINSFNVYSGDRKNPDVVLFGNSKTMGKAASQYGTSLAGLFGIHFSVLNLGGGGDGTAEVLRLLPSALAANGKVYILDGIGRNDIAAGVSLATTEANIATIITAIQAIGAQVIVNTGTYETAVNQAPLAAYTVSTWPTLTQDTYTATSANLGSVYADGIHATDISYSIEYQMDRSAITTIGSYDLTAVNNKLSEFSTALSPLTSSQTANFGLLSPDGTSGLPSFRALAKGDLRNIFKVDGSGGTLDWNDATNNLPGVGPTLLAGTATNGMGGSAFYYVFNISYIGTAATNNHVQYAFPYNGNIVWYRTYFSSAFGSWHQVVDGDDTQTLTNKTLTAPTLTGTTTASTVMASTINASGSNIWMPSQTNIISTGVTPAQFAGSTTVFLRAGLGFSTTSSTLTAGASYANTIVGAAPLTLPTTGTTPWAANAVVTTLGTVTNASGIPLTNTTNLYVEVPSGAGTNNYSAYINGRTAINGNLSLSTAGNKLSIAIGTNASVGTATLTAGTVTVSTTAVTSSSKIFLTVATTGALTNIGTPTVGTIVNGTSFVINSSNILDTSNINWWIIN